MVVKLEFTAIRLRSRCSCNHKGKLYVLMFALKYLYFKGFAIFRAILSSNRLWGPYDPTFSDMSEGKNGKLDRLWPFTFVQFVSANERRVSTALERKDIQRREDRWPCERNMWPDVTPQSVELYRNVYLRRQTLWFCTMPNCQREDDDRSLYSSRLPGIQETSVTLSVKLAYYNLHTWWTGLIHDLNFRFRKNSSVNWTLNYGGLFKFQHFLTV